MATQIRPDETFQVRLTQPLHCDHQGRVRPGTIHNDDGTPPFVRVLSPNGGETFVCDQIVKLSWEAADDVAIDHVDLYVSFDNGSSYDKIASNESNDCGTYDWQVPRTASTRVSVQGRGDGFQGQCRGGRERRGLDDRLPDSHAGDAVPGRAGVGRRVAALAAAGREHQIANLSLERSASEIGPWSPVLSDQLDEGGVIGTVDRGVPGRTDVLVPARGAGS